MRVHQQRRQPHPLQRHVHKGENPNHIQRVLSSKIGQYSYINSININPIIKIKYIPFLFISFAGEPGCLESQERKIAES